MPSYPTEFESPRRFDPIVILAAVYTLMFFLVAVRQSIEAYSHEIQSHRWRRLALDAAVKLNESDAEPIYEELSKESSEQ